MLCCYKIYIGPSLSLTLLWQRVVIFFVCLSICSLTHGLFVQSSNFFIVYKILFSSHLFGLQSEELTKQESFSRDEPEECEPPVKKYRLRSRRGQPFSPVVDSSTSFDGTSLIPQHREEVQVFQSSCQQKVAKSIHRTGPMTVSPLDYNEKGKKSISPHSCSVLGRRSPSPLLSDDENAESSGPQLPQMHLKDSDETSLSLQHRRSKKRLTYEGGSNLVPSTELKTMPNDVLYSMKEKLDYHNGGLHEAMQFADEFPQHEVPLAIIRPGMFLPPPPPQKKKIAAQISWKLSSSFIQNVNNILNLPVIKEYLI